ncbi:hypothetical protein SAMD00023353_12100050 [Rosellinia necatrix]|uniref:Uncharacterized protein n=1 Tax=Rosellinia necatrix TaxID=77044 RepID=A0A1W2TXB8_ROSNE|nr:hypothetical protein SAMD00023353_12100050 [Rosellinia necatrix]
MFGTEVYPGEFPVSMYDPVPDGYVFVARRATGVMKRCRRRAHVIGQLMYLVEGLAGEFVGVRVPFSTFEAVMENMAKGDNNYDDNDDYDGDDDGDGYAYGRRERESLVATDEDADGDGNDNGDGNPKLVSADELRIPGSDVTFEAGEDELLIPDADVVWDPAFAFDRERGWSETASLGDVEDLQVDPNALFLYEFDGFPFLGNLENERRKKEKEGDTECYQSLVRLAQIRPLVFNDT